jgi:hypothetical protein
MRAAGYDLNKFHFIGHSLGAHLLGRMGQQFITDQNITLRRITGLDPASAWFGNFNTWPTNAGALFPSLNKLNAKFVDIIHSDAGWVGVNYASGHMDFWPNKGNNQPLCSVVNIFDLCNSANGAVLLICVVLS